MPRSLFGVSLALSLSAILWACHAAPFHAPEQPDLYKVPHDFGLAGAGPGSDLASDDLSVDDLSKKEGHPDLSTHHDDLGTEHD